jgi:broad-specificity NMP kinase
MYVCFTSLHYSVHLGKISKEGKAFTVPLDVATMSELIKSMKDEDEEDDDSKPMQVPLPNVKSDVLEKVIEFCQHHLVRRHVANFVADAAFLIFVSYPYCLCHSIGRAYV